MAVAAVIPAYNEERTIAMVLQVLKRIPYIQEIVVVSDGSTDATAQVARQLGVRVVELTDNCGKGFAMMAGLEVTQADVVLFLDADLIGLTEQHVQELLAPVMEGLSEMAVGVFDGGRTSTDLAQALMPFLSGQRVVRRDLLRAVDDLDAARYGVEIALTRYIRKHRSRVAEVVLRDMTHLTKEEKLGLVRGFAARMKMYWEIMRVLQKEQKNTH